MCSQNSFVCRGLTIVSRVIGPCVFLRAQHSVWQRDTRSFVLLQPLLLCAHGIFSELSKTRLVHMTWSTTALRVVDVVFVAFALLFYFYDMNMFTFWFQKAGKVRCSLKFNYRPQSMIKTDGFWKLCCMQFFPFLFLFKRKINNIILLAFFSWLSSLRLDFFLSPLSFEFLSAFLSYFLKDSGLLPVIIISWILWLWAKMLIVTHEARMDGFSPVFSSHTVSLCSWWEGEASLRHPDFAMYSDLWSLGEQGHIRDIRGKIIVKFSAKILG